MIRNNQARWIITLLCLSVVQAINASIIDYHSEFANHENNLESSFNSHFKLTPDNYLDTLNNSFLLSISNRDTAKARILLNEILGRLKKSSDNLLSTSNSQYSIGVYYLIRGNSWEALNWFRQASSLRDRLVLEDEIHSKCLYNMGVAYFNIGDYQRMAECTLRSVEIDRKLFGDSDPKLIGGLSSLVTANLNLNEYKNAIDYGNMALDLVDSVDVNLIPTIAALYTNIGVCHTWLSDYSKAVLYFEQAESIYRKYNLPEDVNYINLLNCLGAGYYFLGMDNKSDEYFNKGFRKISTSDSPVSLNLLNSFAIVMGNAGNVERGNEILRNTLEQARNLYGTDSRNYIQVLKNYADYLRNYKLDPEKSLMLYKDCADFAGINGDDIQLNNSIFLGYAESLYDNGFYKESLEVLQRLLFKNKPGTINIPELDNPSPELIEPVIWSINLLRAKYNTVWGIYSETGDVRYLIAAAKTSEIVIGLIDNVRVNINEDESRVLLGDRYRNIYIFAMRDFDLCFKITGENKYLLKAFEYSERSKVAGLLASTRELRAVEFHLPPEAAELEKKLKSEIGFYEAKIAGEEPHNNNDESMISEWKSLVLKSTQRRDSLLRYFAKQFPEYYLMKYNTDVIDPDKIPEVAGRKTNYLSYVVSDTVLYIFLKNKKTLQLRTTRIDSSFFKNLSEFRDMLSYPGNNERSDFQRFTMIGNYLYNLLIKPVEKFFISDRLMISPDNILSYIPFEAIPVSSNVNQKPMFNEISYLMADYRISYTYSATFLAESVKRKSGIGTRLIAFAPVYTGTVSLDSLLGNRQGEDKKLIDLPYARSEAKFVSDLTRGRLFINDAARESVFKSEAGKYDIIHLAMHTVLNDRYPMYSKMLFYQAKDSSDDGNLNTWEVYGVPLKAKMVILSSCNTGNGILHSGEGILSLARGFIYAGSQSVIMSIWEIEDRSGTEIVESFYKYLKNGSSKSDALRKARIKYLKNADMLRSHPYFWSSLVIYGNDSPLYHKRKLLISGAFLITILVLAFAVYFRRPR